MVACCVLLCFRTLFCAEIISLGHRRLCKKAVMNGRVHSSDRASPLPAAVVRRGVERLASSSATQSNMRCHYEETASSPSSSEESFQMALRLGRGLFRLWLVLSVLWIGGVGVTTWWRLPVDLCATPPGGLHGCDANEVTESLRLVEKETNSPPEFDPSKPYRIPFDDLRHTTIKFGAAEAVLPPIFVLALGSALVWAFRGFR